MLLVTVLVLVLVALGNSATATKLATAKKIEISGAVKGSSEFDGGNNINIITEQNNIAVIEAIITTPAQGEESTKGSITFNYPTGFNKNNCVIISLMSQNTGNDEQSYNTSSSIGLSTEEVRGCYGLQGSLRSDGILISLYKVNKNAQQKNIHVRIVLMKLPTLVEGVDYILGDVNGDGQITLEDKELLLNYCVGNTGLTYKQTKSADVNKDGMITSADGLLIDKYANGLISKFD